MPRKKPSETRQARQFAIILPLALCLLAAGFYYLGDHPTRAIVALGSAVAAVLCALLAYPLWLRFFRLWMKFANVMSVVMSTLILTIFFYVIFSPITLVRRMLGKKMLDLEWKDSRRTYWIDKQAAELSLARYEKQF